MNSVGQQSCEIIIKEKTPLSHKVLCFQMLDFGTSKSNSEVSKSNSWKITSFTITLILQREPFLTILSTALSIACYQVSFSNFHLLNNLPCFIFLCSCRQAGVSLERRSAGGLHKLESRRTRQRAGFRGLCTHNDIGVRQVGRHWMRLLLAVSLQETQRYVHNAFRYSLCIGTSSKW